MAWPVPHPVKIFTQTFKMHSRVQGERRDAQQVLNPRPHNPLVAGSNPAGGTTDRFSQATTHEFGARSNRCSFASFVCIGVFWSAESLQAVLDNMDTPGCILAIPPGVSESNKGTQNVSSSNVPCVRKDHMGGLRPAHTNGEEERPRFRLVRRKAHLGANRGRSVKPRRIFCPLIRTLALKSSPHTAVPNTKGEGHALRTHL
jgi:hypothetical protein